MDIPNLRNAEEQINSQCAYSALASSFIIVIDNYIRLCRRTSRKICAKRAGFYYHDLDAKRSGFLEKYLGYPLEGAFCCGKYPDPAAVLSSATENTFIIAPMRSYRICGRTPFIIFTAPQKFVFNSRSDTSSPSLAAAR